MASCEKIYSVLRGVANTTRIMNIILLLIKILILTTREKLYTNTEHNDIFGFATSCYNFHCKPYIFSQKLNNLHTMYPSAEVLSNDKQKSLTLKLRDGLCNFGLLDLA